ncbi:helix-turn-helix domain-containing protein [Nonomuraea sp. NPDC049714]|uniref:helix-turn-helix domain-containing protein n=1 Tax=Nonomuraea sp. NPDC049714 TaxID=3364357 RepID=UPI0037B8B925
MAIHADRRTHPAAVPGPGSGAGHERHFDPHTELSEFLRTRRARLKPADVGLSGRDRRRRVPGLRREELAQLAGVSVAYYTRLEQGNARNVSVEVLNAISGVLELSDAEHAHLLHLAKPSRHRARTSGRCGRPTTSRRSHTAACG